MRERTLRRLVSVNVMSLLVIAVLWALSYVRADYFIYSGSSTYMHLASSCGTLELEWDVPGFHHRWAAAGFSHVQRDREVKARFWQEPIASFAGRGGRLDLEGENCVVAIPYLFLFICFSAVPYWWLVLGGRQIHARMCFAAGICPQCRYDLRASEGRCPECGELIPQSRKTRHE